MGRARRSPISTALLLVYLAASVVGPGLHHHDHPAVDHQAAAHSAAKLCHRLSTQAAEDYPDNCPICIALHQAKTPPAILSLPAYAACLGAAVSLAAPERPLPVPITTHARSPPLF